MPLKLILWLMLGLTLSLDKDLRGWLMVAWAVIGILLVVSDLVTWWRGRKPSRTSMEEELARDFVDAMVTRTAQRRHSNWSPAVSRARRQEWRKIKDKNHVDWSRLQLVCKQRNLNYEELVGHIKRLAKEYKIEVK